MAIAIKALLLKKNDQYGPGLNAIRHHANDLIDIGEYEAGVSDATTTSIYHRIVKDNVCYKTVKTYFDLDTNSRIFICTEATDPVDVFDNVISIDSADPTIAETITNAKDGTEIDLNPGEITVATDIKSTVTLLGETSGIHKNRVDQNDLEV